MGVRSADVAGGRTVKVEELEHIRADIAAALPEAQYVDHSLLPDLIDHLLTALGRAATGELFIGGDGADTPNWAAELLRGCQTRAVSQIPFYGRELEGDEPPHWEEHR